MMCRVALVVPETDLRKMNIACPPFNLGYIASYLRKQIPEVHVKIVDGAISKEPYSVEHEIFNFQPNIVGITATTPQAPAAYRLADTLKTNRPDIFVVMGGIHASNMPLEASEHVDCVVVGEGEKTFTEIVKKRMLGLEVPKILEGEPIEELDEIPSLAFDLLDIHNYLGHGPQFPHLINPIVGITTSRGCPFRCPFCWNASRRFSVRYFSAERIVEEILFFHQKYGVNDFFFNDDEFLINKNRLQKLAVLFREHGIGKWIRWACQSRAKSVREDTLQLMKSMGCVGFSVGFESASPRTLKYLKCGTTTVEDNAKALRIAEKVGLTVGGSFIFGIPDETLEEMRETFKWCEQHDDLKFIGINTIIPYPGTEVWNQCRKRGLLPEKVDYERLVPTSIPELTYIVSTLPPKTFNRFMVDIQRIAWILAQSRLYPTLKDFVKHGCYKTWWWCWLMHPCKMLKILKKLLLPRKMKL